MRMLLDWLWPFRRFRPPPPQTDPSTYHARRLAQEQTLLYRAKCPAAIRAHHRLAAAHREAMRASAPRGDIARD